MPTISVCMITKNAEKSLKQCLDSVSSVMNELIVVDTGSADKTKEIATTFKAKVVDFSWQDDFSKARNESLKHATKEWILVIDADEQIQNPEEIQQAIENASDEVGGVKITQRSYLENNMTGAKRSPREDYPFYVDKHLVRLFRNKQGFSFTHRVHELVEDSITSKNMKIADSSLVFDHYGAEASNEKRAYYEKLIELQLKDDPDSVRYNYQAGQLFLGKQEYTKALGHFLIVARQDPQYKLIFSDIGKVYVKLNQFAKAVTAYKKSLEVKPDNLSTANNLAVVYLIGGYKKQARELLEPYVKKYPDNKVVRHHYDKAQE